MKDITRLFELVIVQEEIYGEILSLHGLFHDCHMIIEQFLQIQLRSRTGQRRCDSFSSIAQLFDKKLSMA